MARHANTTKAALVVALALALAACVKQGDQPAASTSVAASEPRFPKGKDDKPTTLIECEKLPNPKPIDDSAAGRAAAVGQGQTARAACNKEVAQQDKLNGDLVRIRALKAKEEADQEARKVSEAEWKRGVKEGAKQPIKEYKY